MRLSFSSDRLNPMLVRDLRQVLRSRVFTLVFLLLQGGMAFFVVLGLSSSNEAAVSSILHSILWGGLIVFYFIMLPAIAASSLVPEFSDNRLDLLKLTQMSARGLMMGKWLSLCAQGAMVAVSLLPYLVLSYYSGGVELGSELSLMALMLAASSLLIAFCLAVSSMNSRILRGLLVLLYVVALFGGFTSFIDRPSGRGVVSIFTQPSFSIGIVIAVGILAVIGVAALWLCLEFGAARLAPSAENHDTPQRLLLPVLGLLLVVFFTMDALRPSTGIYLIIGSALETVCYVLFALMIWILIQALATDPSPYPDTYRFYQRKGPLLRWLGRLALYPGWPSAVFLILFLSALFEAFGYGLCYFYPKFNSWTVLMYCLVVPAGLIFPQVVGVELRRTRLSSNNRYLTIVAICLVVMIGCLLFANSVNQAYTQQSFLVAACIFPPDAMLLLPSVDWDIPEFYYAIGLAVITGVPTIVIGVRRAIQYWPKFAEVERRAAALNEAAKLARSTPLSPAKAVPASMK